jgi:DNA polymerase-3 subunit delta
MEEKPVIYILHGDDEFAMEEFISGIVAKMGDESTAEMNTTLLDGKTFTMDSLVSATYAMPFLAERRLVILNDPLGEIKSPKTREKFKITLESIPPTTGLVLRISRPLVSERDKRRGIRHWLQEWAVNQGSRVYIREFPLLKQHEMVGWIQNKATELGGNFSHQAALQLADYVLNDPRLATQEIHKLLAYVNYSRQVEPDDVIRLTPYAAEGDVFKMVDALGNQDAPTATRMLHRLMEVDDPLRLFGMIVRQFRMLIQTRELLDAGQGEGIIARELKTYPFIARKMIVQARNFSTQALERIYHRLLETDEAIKTGQMEGDVALDILVTSLTFPGNR